MLALKSWKSCAVARIQPWKEFLTRKWLSFSDFLNYEFLDFIQDFSWPQKIVFGFRTRICARFRELKVFHRAFSRRKNFSSASDGAQLPSKYRVTVFHTRFFETSRNLFWFWKLGLVLALMSWKSSTVACNKSWKKFLPRQWLTPLTFSITGTWIS